MGATSIGGQALGTVPRSVHTVVRAHTDQVCAGALTPACEILHSAVSYT